MSQEDDAIVAQFQDQIDMIEWWRMGASKGWIDDTSFCYVHDGPPLTEEEQQIEDEDDDLDAICIACVRIYPYGRSTSTGAQDE